MQAIYENVTTFLLGKLKGKTLEYIIIMTLLGGIFYLQYHYLSEMVREKNAYIEKLVADFRQEQTARERWMQSYIDCEKTSSQQTRAAIERVERLLAK